MGESWREWDRVGERGREWEKVGTLAHGAHIGVNLGLMLGMVLKNKYNL